MKKIIIPFSLSEYQKGGYSVQTRYGKNVRVICTDRTDNDYPIVALVKNCNKEAARFFSENGESIIEEESIYDSFLVKQEFEDGDIVIREGDDVFGSFILPYRGTNEEGGILTEVYLYYFPYSLNIKKGIDCGCGYIEDYRLATEEEKQKLFVALEKEGKRWNAETKQVEDIENKSFKPKDWCLMRTASDYAWCLCQFSNMDSESYVAIGGAMHEYCIPYNDETKHILGTTEDAPEKYKTW
jgi:hypothetical protein